MHHRISSIWTLEGLNIRKYILKNVSNFQVYFLLILYLLNTGKYNITSPCWQHLETPLCLRWVAMSLPVLNTNLHARPIRAVAYILCWSKIYFLDCWDEHTNTPDQILSAGFTREGNTFTSQIWGATVRTAVTCHPVLVIFVLFLPFVSLPINFPRDLNKRQTVCFSPKPS